MVKLREEITALKKEGEGGGELKSALDTATEEVASLEKEVEALKNDVSKAESDALEAREKAVGVAEKEAADRQADAEAKRHDLCRRLEAALFFIDNLQ